MLASVPESIRKSVGNRLRSRKFMLPLRITTLIILKITRMAHTHTNMIDRRTAGYLLPSFS